jgi:hypothetical protein
VGRRDDLARRARAPHLWEVAVGICSPSVIPRDFPAVTLPALLGIGLTAWARFSRPR